MNTDFLTTDQKLEIVGLLNYIEDLIVCAKWKHDSPEQYKDKYRNHMVPSDAISVAMLLKNAGDEVHSGDCTNMPAICERCVHDEWMQKLDKYMSAFKQELELDQ
jgi:hypothetical protein